MILPYEHHTPSRVTHRTESPAFPDLAICRVLVDMWRYVKVCEFFHDAVCRAAEQVNGGVAFDYPLAIISRRSSCEVPAGLNPSRRTRIADNPRETVRPDG